MFPTTRWTLILASRAGTEARRSALEQLLTVYWKPVYLYVRRKGFDIPDAEDAVQGFFARLLERDFLTPLDPGKGRFRGYLKTAVDHYLVNLHGHATALKRGGDVRFVPLDAVLAERDFAQAPEDPDLAYDREWALGVMERALTRLRKEYVEGRRRGDVQTVVKFFGLEGAPSYAEAAAASGMTVSQFKASLHRARARFRELLRDEVADTVGDESEAGSEMAELVRILRA